MLGILYMVATPIGNMSDISERGLATLRSVDLVFAEDTRVTRRLLDRIGSVVRVLRYDHHSHEKQLPFILKSLEDGLDIAYVTDAGTPGIEDPGGRLVAGVLEVYSDLRVVPIPGVSAVMALLSVSGFVADKFSVLGFPPKKKGRQTYFDRVSETLGTVVIYEAVHRIVKTLGEIAKRQPEREIVVGREITKMHETFYRGSALEVLELVEADSIRGEYMIVLK